MHQVDYARQSPLHIACANGDVETVALLLEHNSVANLVVAPFRLLEHALGRENE